MTVERVKGEAGEGGIVGKEGVREDELEWVKGKK